MPELVSKGALPPISKVEYKDVFRFPCLLPDNLCYLLSFHERCPDAETVFSVSCSEVFLPLRSGSWVLSLLLPLL